ncbi:MAG: hypothetical protein ACI3V5_09275, partial [Faecousia sp.]
MAICLDFDWLTDEFMLYCRIPKITETTSRSRNIPAIKYVFLSQVSMTFPHVPAAPKCRAAPYGKTSGTLTGYRKQQTDKLE